MEGQPILVVERWDSVLMAIAEILKLGSHTVLTAIDGVQMMEGTCSDVFRF
jgi:hypothetical protein